MTDAGLRRFYLARHGVTIVNVLRERRAGEDEPLLPAGREQARMLAGRVRELDIEKVWTSPLRRARGAAEVVAEACGLPLEVAPGLREIGAHDEAADGDREDFDDAVARVGETLERIIGQGRVFLGVTHVGAMRIARVLLCGASWDTFEDFSPDHCQLVSFRRSGHAWEVHVE